MLAAPAACRGVSITATLQCGRSQWTEFLLRSIAAHEGMGSFDFVRLRRTSLRMTVEAVAERRGESFPAPKRNQPLAECCLLPFSCSIYKTFTFPHPGYNRGQVWRGPQPIVRGPAIVFHLACQDRKTNCRRHRRAPTLVRNASSLG
jgi:hypothetical protein